MYFDVTFDSFGVVERLPTELWAVAQVGTAENDISNVM